MATMNLHMPATLTGALTPNVHGLPSIGTVLSAIRDAFVVRVDSAPSTIDLAAEHTKLDGQAKARFWI
jgi:hypothetical protein